MGTPPVDLPRILDAFDGVARLFPLPSLVLFPDAFAPLQVFEERYVAMVKDALPDDGLVATALLKPGYETDYQGSPPIHEVVCLGRILRPRTKPNGHIEFLLYGLARARLLEEIPHHPYRKARVELLEDVVLPGQQEVVARRMRRALDLVPGRQPMIWGLRRMAEQLRGADGEPGRYADAVAHFGDLPGEIQYQALAETDVLKRLDLVIRSLEQRALESAPHVVPPRDPRLN